MDAPAATKAGDRGGDSGAASARDLETADAPPLCGPPLPWDCSIFDAVKKDAHETAPAAPPPGTEGSAILPPFVGVASTASPVQRGDELGSGFHAGWEIAGGLVLLAAVGFAVVARRATMGRKKRPAALDCAG